jgi:hypothetical protein
MRDNRVAGHNFDRWLVNLVKDEGLYPDAVSSRSESRRRDDQKVDLCYTGNMNFQCKLSNTKVDYVKVLGEMPVEEGRFNIIVEKKTKKSPNGRFMEEGKYVHMDFKSFLTILKEYEKSINGTYCSCNTTDNG